MDDLSTTHILVTGTNGGLGLSICARLVDDFLLSRSHGRLNIIFTTRSKSKSTQTRQYLQAYLTKHHAAAAHTRISFQPEHVELTDLASVRALATRLNASSLSHLNAIICNAGMAGWSGLAWFTAIPEIICDMRTATTWPSYKLGVVGLVTPDQEVSAPDHKKQEEAQLALGQIFGANVFGHYLLAHWLMPLLHACPSEDAGKLIWVSSIEARAPFFTLDDLQGLKTDAPYEHTKRLTDILALTSDQPPTSRFVQEYLTAPPRLAQLQSRPRRSTPTVHVAHPGVCPTSIISLYWIVHQFYIVGIYVARLIGAPWSSFSTYTAALVFTHLALTPTGELKDAERALSPSTTPTPATHNTRSQPQPTSSGGVKWGAGTTRLGTGLVRPTEVDGWGLNGSGTPFADTWWAGRRGRFPGSRDATREDVEEFIDLGAQVWQAMEGLRMTWEDRIEAWENEKTG